MNSRTDAHKTFADLYRKQRSPEHQEQIDEVIQKSNDIFIRIDLMKKVDEEFEKKKQEETKKPEEDKPKKIPRPPPRLSPNPLEKRNPILPSDFWRTFSEEIRRSTNSQKNPER